MFDDSYTLFVRFAQSEHKGSLRIRALFSLSRPRCRPRRIFTKSAPRLGKISEEAAECIMPCPDPAQESTMHPSSLPLSHHVSLSQQRLIVASSSSSSSSSSSPSPSAPLPLLRCHFQGDGLTDGSRADVISAPSLLPLPPWRCRPVSMICDRVLCMTCCWDERREASDSELEVSSHSERGERKKSSFCQVADLPMASADDVRFRIFT